ncbi:uncharacterized protein CTHT_0018060 [Thermochaetoides thermophila DSM 1495]|uniref:Uncharacterized protein n=1 Tax=Chaetomium thermophilum (strain DSM 1495 / CBS 144.50 / IMI 039719) TaxID=759272 RepID=G0S2Q2_CHATD|nr:hypothetical protein CTHT_0018060 [Thermochaetoides thermophila DSM 1495]EGS22285.1 hypothetical protein CTHT_0018060 [Thermochaetoides thermophila DSM 1495]
MGKPDPTLSAPVPSQGPGESSSGSNTSIPPQRLPDHNIPIPDPNDLPPLYSEIDNDVLLDAPLLNQTQDSNPLDFDDGFTYPTGLRTINSSNLNACYLSSDLATDPVELQSFVTRLASHPPRPHIRILGTHDETEVRDGKKSTRVETDFDISIDLTPYLYAPDRQAWSELRTVENHESTRRGTVFASRAPGVQGDLELAGQAKPTLTEWCHRFSFDADPKHELQRAGDD